MPQRPLLCRNLNNFLLEMQPIQKIVEVASFWQLVLQLHCLKLFVKRILCSQNLCTNQSTLSASFPYLFGFIYSFEQKAQWSVINLNRISDVFALYMFFNCKELQASLIVIPAITCWWCDYGSKTSRRTKNISYGKTPSRFQSFNLIISYMMNGTL